MCTAVLSIQPGQPILLAGVRDELTDRAWQPPARHWPEYPDLIGGREKRRRRRKDDLAVPGPPCLAVLRFSCHRDWTYLPGRGGKQSAGGS